MYPYPIVVDKDIPEDDCFNFIHLHLVCWNPIQEFLFKGCKEAFHYGVIKTVIYTTETLKNTCVTERLAKCFACVLASSITMHLNVTTPTG